MIEHQTCLHEKEIILLVDHSEETRQNVRLLLKLLMGNGEAGIITTQKLHEQSLRRLWAVVKYAGGSLGTLGIVATVVIKFFGD